MMKGERVALVTGAAGGLGSVSARRLGEDGFRVILVGRSQTVHELSETLNAEGIDSVSKVVDLADAAQIINLAAELRSDIGRCDVLVNNAGVHPIKPNIDPEDIEETALEDWNFALAVNLTAPFLLSREIFPMMRERRWGRIVNISSRAGRTVIPGTAAHYGATKAGLIGLSRVIAHWGAPFGVTSNTIAPGRFPTSMANTMTPEAIAASLKLIPVGRVGDPEEIAAMVSFLASDASAYTTGAVIDVNGGAFMG
jgi:3-oxoacyl-[acyl-carrier protein] reductase